MRPEPWATGRKHIKHVWFVPFFAMEWGWEWIAYFLSNWKFLEVLEYMGSLSVLVAVLFYFSESGDRTKQKHYQAWQVVNTAQGKGGSGGRIEALQELNADRVPLVGVDVSGAFLQGIDLRGAGLLRSNFNAADLRESNFAGADFTDADLSAANFRGSSLAHANFHGADLHDADLTGADLTGANLAGASLENADLREADLDGIEWKEIANIRNVHVDGAKKIPSGFAAWAIEKGAISAAGAGSNPSVKPVK
ncbi:MAG: pentapeptide repeat-containing protein [Candidatus Acidiferrales bacterium]